MSTPVRTRLLAIDTATAAACLALGDRAGAPVASRSWPAGRRHGETLLGEIELLLRGAAMTPAELAGIVVGIGPGTFTGLRVGLATAKALAHDLAVPLVGIPTAHALALAASAGGAPSGPMIILLPAGPSDRYCAPVRVVGGRIEPLDAVSLLPLADPVPAPAGATVVAVDLPAGAPGIDTAAAALGGLAVAGLGEALLELGRGALDAGRADDAATLVPAYVTLPRGAAAGNERWSPDLR